MVKPPPDLIAKAEAVTALWDLMLFSTGNANARQRRADVMHEAILNLQASISEAREGAA
jgi:hypothetical protein